MTLRTEISESAFWHGKICLACDTAVEEDEEGQECPECGGAMKLRKSRFGPGFYLGCTKYPKCKGTAKVTPALQTKIDAATSGAGAPAVT